MHSRSLSNNIPLLAINADQSDSKPDYHALTILSDHKGHQISTPLIQHSELPSLEMLSEMSRRTGFLLRESCWAPTLAICGCSILFFTVGLILTAVKLDDDKPVYITAGAVAGVGALPILYCCLCMLYNWVKDTYSVYYDPINHIIAPAEADLIVQDAKKIGLTIRLQDTAHTIENKMVAQIEEINTFTKRAALTYGFFKTINKFPAPLVDIIINYLAKDEIMQSSKKWRLK